MNSITDVPYQTTYWNELHPNPLVLLIIAVILIAYFSLFSTVGSGNDTTASTPNSSMIYVEVLLVGVFLLLILMNGMTYVFNVDITASIKNLFSAVPEIDIIVDPEDLVGGLTDSITTVPEIKIAKQVFHIPDNTRNYQDAKAICRAYDARLATWKEMDEAYDKGADWCSFGWSDGQMALYPTQYDKWEKLQTVKGHEHDCGRPGINGGYIANPEVRFGANCYGYKPKITQDEAAAMKLAPLYPKTRRERAFDKRVDYMKNNLSEQIVAPFNHDNWSIL